MDKEELRRLREENIILNKILRNIFPDIIYGKDDMTPDTFQPIFDKSKTLTQENTFRLSTEGNQVNMFIRPTKINKRNQKPSIATENRPYRFSIFDHFGSVSELKDVLKDDPSYITRVNGIHNLKQTTRPVGRSLKSVLKKMFSRYKRSVYEDDNLILKRPAIFENTRDEIHSSNNQQNKRFKVPEQNYPTTYYQSTDQSNTLNPSNTPSKLYQVPDISTFTSPSSFYQVPPSTPSSFYEVPPPLGSQDSSVHPSTIVQILQEQGSTLHSSQTSSSDSVQQSSIVLSKPSAIASLDTAIVSSKPLPAINTSFTSNTAAASSSGTRVSTLDRNTAALAAFGLSLIPALAVTVPFLVPSLRRGKTIHNYYDSDLKHEDDSEYMSNEIQALLAQ